MFQSLRNVWLGGLCAVVVAWSVVVQDPWTYNGGLGWDGAEYVRLTDQCWRTPLSATEPFAYRIGAPCLAALVPLPPKHALWLINVVCSILLLGLLDAWLRRSVATSVVPWLLAAFALHWLTPLRHVWWYPTYIDPPALCAMVGALLLAHRPLPFAAVCLIGALIRETMLIVPAGVVVGQLIEQLRGGPALTNPRALALTKPLLAGIAGVLACLLAMVLTRLLVTPTTDYWMLDSAIYWAYEKPLPNYLLALFITFGPALVLLVLRPATIPTYLRAHPAHAVILAAVLTLAWIGGTDTERFLIWGSPIVLVLLGRAAEQLRWRQATAPAMMLVVGQMINGRWFVATPDHVLNEVPRHWPLLTPLMATRSALLFSETPDRMMNAVALMQYAAFTAVLWAWFIWCERRARFAPAGNPS